MKGISDAGHELCDAVMLCSKAARTGRGNNHVVGLEWRIADDVEDQSPAKT